jgi:hypothetical protein
MRKEQSQKAHTYTGSSHTIRCTPRRPTIPKGGVSILVGTVSAGLENADPARSGPPPYYSRLFASFSAKDATESAIKFLINHPTYIHACMQAVPWKKGSKASHARLTGNGSSATGNAPSISSARAHVWFFCQNRLRDPLIRAGQPRNTPGIRRRSEKRESLLTSAHAPSTRILTPRPTIGHT